MNVKSLIKLPRTVVYPQTPLIQVWELLSQRRASLLPVVSKEEGTLLGVIDEEDLLFRLVPDYREFFSDFFPDVPGLEDLEEKLEKEIALSAKDVMNDEGIVIRENQPIFKALSKMMVYHVCQLPVVNEERKYLGMIFEGDIFEFLFAKHKSVVRKKNRRK